MLFVLRFILNEFHFILIDHILSDVLFLVSFCILFPTMYSKIKSTAKSCPDLCNFNNKVIVLNVCLRKYLLFFFVDCELLVFDNNIVKISHKKMNKQTFLKICLQVTYPTISAQFAFVFNMGKCETICFCFVLTND